MVEISTIISTFNRAQYLGGLFDSILSQSLERSRYEPILVDKGIENPLKEKRREF